jgi:hypothetical protein
MSASNDDEIRVRCMACRFTYTTSLGRFTAQRNACDSCGSTKAQRLDPPVTEPPPFQETSE